MDGTASWRALMLRPEPALDEAALVIAAHANPELDIAGQLARLDAIAVQIGQADADGVCKMLFGTMGICGDEQHYDDPRNSYLDQVLDRRLGIPISLSVLLIEVGRRCGLELAGVGMPGHYLVRDLTVPALLIDAFAGGARLDHSACERLLRKVAGANANLVPTMLASTSRHATLARMLVNLDRSFRLRADRKSLIWVTRLRSLIPGVRLGARVEMAHRLAELGAFESAAEVLSEVIAEPGLGDELAGRLQNSLVRLRARLN